MRHMEILFFLYPKPYFSYLKGDYNYSGSYFVHTYGHTCKHFRVRDVWWVGVSGSEGLGLQALGDVGISQTGLRLYAQNNWIRTMKT